MPGDQLFLLLSERNVSRRIGREKVLGFNAIGVNFLLIAKDQMKIRDLVCDLINTFAMCICRFPSGDQCTFLAECPSRKRLRHCLPLQELQLARL